MSKTINRDLFIFPLMGRLNISLRGQVSFVTITEAEEILSMGVAYQLICVAYQFMEDWDE